VIGAALAIAAIGSGAHAIGSLTGVPFGPYVYTQDMGRPLFGALPWMIPFIWVIFVLSSRGTARLVLRRWRTNRNFGFLVIGLTTILTVLLDLGLEVFATKLFTYWEWSGTKLPLDLFDIPATNFFGWGLVCLLILAFATPLLINKRPSGPSPPDYHPLAIWVLLDALFGIGAMKAEEQSAALLMFGAGIIVFGIGLLQGWRTRHARG
jgi:putative membrane protein